MTGKAKHEVKYVIMWSAEKMPAARQAWLLKC
ncbi:hypothetical protein T01_2461 [Trichinella spiralis]|uniref:Uncharacterized protein n=1 Tax=Trichinella spiralis TaxID=6334 RepID=A0A0V0YP50_TRISP|nr:hypothetical protein T01_2461 [Trichinella spiralis]